MGRALVVYESMYGNTELVAHAIGRGLRDAAGVEVFEVGAAPTSFGEDVALLVVGGPTHAFGMSRPSTRADAAEQAGAPVISAALGVREWLERLNPGRARPAAAAFDTHVEHPKLLRHVGSAGASIAGRLVGLGLEIVAPAEHFWVHGSPGPLVDGEEERAEQWGRMVGLSLARDRAGTPSPERAHPTAPAQAG